MITFKVREHLGQTIDLRDSVVQFFHSKVSHSAQSEVFLDFTGVTFVSRAAADQILKENKRCAVCAVKIIMTNMNHSVEQMFMHVAQSSSNSTKPQETRTHVIQDNHQLVDFLSRILRRG